MDVGFFMLVNEGKRNRVGFKLTNHRFQRFKLAESCHLVSLCEHYDANIAALRSTKLAAFEFLLCELLEVSGHNLLRCAVGISADPFA